MRKVCIPFVVVSFVASPVQAEVNCNLIHQVGLIHSALSLIHLDPLSETILDDTQILDSEFVAVNERMLRRGLAGYAQTSDIDTLSEMVAHAQQMAIATSAHHTEDLIREVRGTAWEIRLLHAATVLQRLPCAKLQTDTTYAIARQSQSTAATTSQPQDTASPASSAQRKKNPLFENPIKLGFTSLLAILTGILILRQITLWSQRRSILEKRRSKRFTIHLTSRMAWREVELETEIIDISCHGAKIKYTHIETIPEGARIDVFIAKQVHSSKVVWSNEHYLGVAFSSTLPIPLVRKVAKVSAFDGLGRPIKKSHRHKGGT